MPTTGNNLDLGIDSKKKTVTLTPQQRSTHLYVCGATGSGKTKFLQHLIQQDIRNWRSSKCGILLIDPHGSLYDSLMEYMYANRLERPIIPIDLRNNEWITAYNMLRHRPGADAGVVAGTFLESMAHVWGSSGVSGRSHLDT